MTRSFPLLLLAIYTIALGAEQATRPPVDSGKVIVPVRNLPYNPAKVALDIRNSYYHPDELTGLDCTISVDWPALFSALKVNVPADRLKVLQGLKIQSRAVRAKIPEFTFDWTSGPFDNSEQFVSGFKQMASGFYQIYWPMIASAPIKDAADITKVEPQQDGSAKVYSSGPNIGVVMTIDEKSIPTHYTVESPVMNGTIDPHYIASPKPVSGDLRRISSVDVTEQVGTSTMNVKLNLDYQEVNGFYVPKHVSFDLVGAYSLSLDFSACSASKDAALSK